MRINERRCGAARSAGPCPAPRRAAPATNPRAATPENVETIVARGRELWASIYEPHAEKLWNKLGTYHPDFIGEHARRSLPSLPFLV